jgi:hypothetical protein
VEAYGVTTPQTSVFVCACVCGCMYVYGLYGWYNVYDMCGCMYVCMSLYCYRDTLFSDFADNLDDEEFLIWSLKFWTTV